jgi:hypothetical protein
LERLARIFLVKAVVDNFFRHPFWYIEYLPKEAPEICDEAPWEFYLKALSWSGSCRGSTKVRKQRHPPDSGCILTPTDNIVNSVCGRIWRNLTVRLCNSMYHHKSGLLIPEWQHFLYFHPDDIPEPRLDGSRVLFIEHLFALRVYPDEEYIVAKAAAVLEDPSGAGATEKASEERGVSMHLASLVVFPIVLFLLPRHFIETALYQMLCSCP